MRALIIGLGIGEVYKEQLTKRNYEIVTVDNFLPATYKDTKELKIDVEINGIFDIGIIATPNYTHQEILDDIIGICDTILVEKPGLKDSKTWKEYINKKSRIVMVKNNQWRLQISGLVNYYNALVNDIEEVNIFWLNKNRIPKPGNWFTNKRLAWGGVSRDLMPHLLSMAIMFIKEPVAPTHILAFQAYCLEHINNSDYGEVNKNGVFDVDDHARVEFIHNNVKFNLLARWKGDEDAQYIEFKFKDGTYLKYNFGLCPNEYYGNMIDEIMSSSTYDVKIDHIIDLWIHDIMDKFDNI